MTRSEFAIILSEMNAGRRDAGQVTAPVCEVWRRDAATARVVGRCDRMGGIDAAGQREAGDGAVGASEGYGRGGRSAVGI